MSDYDEGYDEGYSAGKDELRERIAELEEQTQADIQTMLNKDEQITKLQEENKSLLDELYGSGARRISDAREIDT